METSSQKLLILNQKKKENDQKMFVIERLEQAKIPFLYNIYDA
jgi:hypothetical protein